MEAKKSKKFLNVKQLMRSHNVDQMQLAVILGFLLIAALASLWLPIYFVSLAISGF